MVMHGNKHECHRCGAVCQTLQELCRVPCGHQTKASRGPKAWNPKQNLAEPQVVQNGVTSSSHSLTGLNRQCLRRKEKTGRKEGIRAKGAK